MHKRVVTLSAVALFASACRGEPRSMLYVSNEAAGTISVIDARKRQTVATVAVGKRPRGLRLSPDGKLLYVALSGSPRMPPGADPASAPPPDRAADGIGVVDLATHELVRVLPSGQDPESFDVTRDGRLIIVSNEETAEASIIDVHSGALVATVGVGAEPEGVTMRPDGDVVYVTCEEADRVDVIDVATHRVIARVPTAARPRAIAFTPDGALAVVSAENAGAVTLIDARAHTAVGRIDLPRGAGPTPPRPMGVVVSNDGARAYVAGGRAGSVAVLDLAARRVERTFDAVGDRPWGVALSRDGKILYTANGPSNDVSAIDTRTGEVVARIASAGSPWGVVVGGG